MSRNMKETQQTPHSIQVLNGKYPDLGVEILEQVFKNNNCRIDLTEEFLQRELGAVPRQCVTSSVHNRASQGNWDEDDSLSNVGFGVVANGPSQINGQSRQQSSAMISSNVLNESIEDGEIRDKISWKMVDSPGPLLSYYPKNILSKQCELIGPQVKLIIIMRGLPGSGKSTRAREILNTEFPKSNGGIFSADDYFVDQSSQQYIYKKDLIGRAHLWNRTRVMQNAYKGHSPLIIDNTNLTIREMKPYLAIAKRYGYHVEIEETTTPWRNKPHILASKTIHGVDEERIIFMQARFEKIFNYDSMYASNRNQQKTIPFLAQPSAFPTVGAAATNVSTYHSSSPLNIPIIPPGTSSFPAKTPIRVNDGASSSNAFLTGSQKSSADQALESVLSAAFGTANNVPTGTKPKAPVGFKTPSASNTANLDNSLPSWALGETTECSPIAKKTPKVPKPKDKRVEDKMTTQLTNLTVAAPVFQPTASTYVKRTENTSKRVSSNQNAMSSSFDSVLSEDEKTLLSIFPNQTIDNVRNVLIVHNGSVDMALETLCDVSDQIEDDENQQLDSQECRASSSGAALPMNVRRSKVPTLKEIALRKIDESLGAGSLGNDSLVMLNSSISARDRSTMNSTGIVKDEPNDEDRNPVIDILDSDSEGSEDGDETQNTVIENVLSSTILQSSDGIRLSESTIVAPSSATKADEAVKFKISLGSVPELRATLLNMFGSFENCERKPSIELNRMQLKFIYNAWRKSASEGEDEPMDTTSSSVVSVHNDSSVVEVVEFLSPSLTPEKRKTSAGMNAQNGLLQEQTLIDISSAALDSPSSSTASPKSKKVKRKAPKTNLLNAFNAENNEKSGATSVSLYDIMDEEKRAERSETAQAEAVQLAASIDARSKVGDRTADRVKMDQLAKLFPHVPQKALSIAMNDFNYNMKNAVEILAMQFGDPPEALLHSTKKASYWQDEQPVAASSAVNSNSGARPKETHTQLKPAVNFPDLPNPDRSFQTLSHPDYRDLRAEANMYRNLRQQELDKASAASGPDKAMKKEHYARKAYEYGELMKEAHERAALLTIEQANKERAPNVLDLHKLHVDEAKVAVKNYLLELSDPRNLNRYSTLRIITGWGKNSKGLSKIKPEILKYLRTERYKFVMENQGSIIVYLS